MVEMTRRIEKRGTPGHDHAHHRSVWVAHGLVNGTDNWSEEEGHGRTVHQDFEAMTSGPVTAAIAERCEWVTAAGRRILNEDRNIRFYALPESMRCVDFTITLKTGEDAVLFGDTKEGGMLSVRVNPQINAPAGTIENSFGGVNEDETWGKRAHCDYSGTIDGACRHRHPTTPQPWAPQYWHEELWSDDRELLRCQSLEPSLASAGTGHASPKRRDLPLSPTFTLAMPRGPSRSTTTRQPAPLLGCVGGIAMIGLSLDARC